MNKAAPHNNNKSDQKSRHTMSTMISLLRTNIYNALVHLQNIQWKNLTKMELEYVKFNLGFLRALDCTTENVEDRKTEDLRLKQAEVAIRTEFYLLEGGADPNKQTSKLNTVDITVRSQNIATLLNKIIDQAIHQRPNETDQNQINDMYRILMTRCAMIQYHKLVDPNIFSKKYSNLMNTIAQCERSLKNRK